MLVKNFLSNMSYNTEKASLIHFLVVLALLLILALLITPFLWSLIMITHVVAFALQLLVKICTISVGILQLTVKRFLKTVSACGGHTLKSDTFYTNCRKFIRSMNGAQIHLVLTFCVGFGVYKPYNLVEEQ